MRFLFFLLLLVSPLCAQPAASPPVQAPAKNLIADPVNDPAWRDLFAQLAPQKTRHSKFEERRIFPFRNTPIVLKGEIRISPERGLSLSYLGDKPQVMIMDQKGVLMRDDRGRERAAPSDSRADAATSALFQILRFDLPGLAKSFVIHGRRDGEAWTLGFEPRDATLAGMIGSVIVQGENGRVDRISMVKSEKQRIEISISETRDDVTFTPEELKRFFR
jgi:outer membrane lipoprotein-sorting protein